MQEKKQTGEQNQVLAGRNPVLEALRSGRELECIYIQSGSPKGPVAAILNKAREQGIPVKEATREKLTQLSGIETHQGVAAICAAAAYAEMKDIYERAGEEPLFVVICDNIEDPHNLGAIIRTAEACGAHDPQAAQRRSYCGGSQVLRWGSSVPAGRPGRQYRGHYAKPEGREKCVVHLRRYGWGELVPAGL